MIQYYHNTVENIIFKIENQNGSILSAVDSDTNKVILFYAFHNIKNQRVNGKHLGYVRDLKIIDYEEFLTLSLTGLETIELK